MKVTRKFRDFFKEQITTSTTGMAGNASISNPYGGGDTYASGDNRLPFKVLKKPIKRTKPETLTGIGQKRHKRKK